MHTISREHYIRTRKIARHEQELHLNSEQKTPPRTVVLFEDQKSTKYSIYMTKQRRKRGCIVQELVGAIPLLLKYIPHHRPPPPFDASSVASKRVSVIFCITPVYREPLHKNQKTKEKKLKIVSAEHETTIHNCT